MSEPAVYQLRISLMGIKPSIWRRVQMHEDSTLEDLHDVVQASMGWFNSHLHQFLVGMQCFGPLDDEEVDWSEGDVQDEAEAVLSEVFTRKGSKIIYEYDFGDSWEHEIVLEGKFNAAPDIEYPVCIAGERAAPPEDCGGVFGYENLLDALADPRHPDHDDMVEWLGDEQFDPDEFDLDEANDRLTEMFDELSDDDESRLSRAAIMEIIDTQIESNDPPETAATLDRLLEEGVSEKDARNLVAYVLATEIFDALNAQREFDRKHYVNLLKKLPALPVH
jgi:hypothetical protein